MGNQETHHYIDEQEDYRYYNNPFHPKGKAYELLIKNRLEDPIDQSKQCYWKIYDLRTGLNNLWGFSMRVVGDELNCNFLVLHEGKTMDNITLTSKKVNNYTTLFKGSNVTLELYGDNIHCQKIHELNIKAKLFIYGYIKFDQTKIPIAF